MTTLKQIEIAEHLKTTGLVAKVFHSVQILSNRETGVIYPAYPKGGEYTYSGIDDTHGLFAYIRTAGDAVATPIKIQSCGHAFDVAIPLRVVFFHDVEGRDHEQLTTKLLSFTFIKNVRLIRVISDKFRLQREESPLFRNHFDGKTFYIAVDIFISVILKPSDCESENCIIYPNPIICPVVAPESSSSVM